MSIFSTKNCLLEPITKQNNNIIKKEQLEPSINDNLITIRVLLHENDSKKKSIFNIKSENEFLITTPHSKKKLLINTQELLLTTINNNIFISVQNKNNNQKTTKKIRSKEIRITTTKNDIFTINNNSYRGNLNIKLNQQDKKLLIINNLGLDDYLYSVLVSESYPTWPSEMQKVQSIISRSYAVHYITNARKKNKTNPYDLKRSNFHQTYNGIHKCTHLREAIDATHNLILTYNDKIALTMFDACCGGIVPANIKGVDFNKAPYLPRKQACNFCKNYSLYKGKRTSTPQHLFKQMTKNGVINRKLKNSGTLKSIHILEKDDAGIVHKIKVICSNKKFSVKTSDLWQNLRDKIKSMNFEIHTKKNQIIFEGHGYGHQIGLCQRGARELVNRNWDFKKILNFYYPGTKFARLKKHA